MKRRYSPFCSFLLLLYFVQPQGLYAQRILPLQHLNVSEGLSQSTVYSIMQDRQGFIWFATGDGINRYDGRTFIPYKTRFNDSLSVYPRDRNVNSYLFQDKYDNIWFTSDAGVSYLDTRHGRSKLVHNNLMTGNGVLLGTGNDSVWMAAHDRGLVAYDTSGRGYRQYPYATVPDSVHNIIVAGITTVTAAWIVDHKGLLYFDMANHTFARKFNSGELSGLCRTSDGNLVLGAPDGIYRYNVAKGTADFIPLKYKDKNMQWARMAEDTISHNLYLSALNGGTICKLSLLTGYREFLDFQGSNINDLFIDRSMNLWIGTDGAGVYKLDIKPHKFYCYPVDVPYNAPVENGLMVKSIYRDDMGRFWIGAYYKGLIIYDPATGQAQKVNIPLYGGETQPVSVIMKDSSGEILLAYNNNIVWLDPHSHAVSKHIQLHADKKYTPVGIAIYAVVEWAKGKYIAGTNQGIFSVVDKGNELYASQTYSFLHNHYTGSWTYSLYTNGKGLVYLGTRNGMARMLMTGDTAFHIEDTGFDKVPVRGFYKSKSGPVLWMASELGLIAYNEYTKTYRVFDEGSGMANSYVYAILPQSDTSLWLSTNGGIAHLVYRYHNDSIVNVHFDNYTARDGLQSDEFNTGAYFKDEKGIMIFGGINGINWFDPAMIRPNPYKAVPALAAIEVNDSLYASDTAGFIRTLRLPYSGNTVSFSLRALEYTNPGQNRFAYKLEGIDRDWVYTTGDKVRYADLPPGSYHFMLKVSNNEGVWNDKPLDIHVVISPPFWETWWFRLLVVIVLVVTGYAIVRYYIRQKVRERTRELEKQQALHLERMRISKDVHDDLGSGLSKITLMAELAGKQEKENDKLSDTIEGISRISRDLVGNMRDLVWVLNPDNTTLDSLVARMREYCSDYFEGLPLQLKIDFPASVPALRIQREAQRNIFLTVKEALNNAVKHAKATSINVSLDLDDDLLRIVVCDNGRGFDVAKAKGGGNGLKNMKQRIDAIGGSFDIVSQPGGTSARISISLEKISIVK